MPSPSWWKQFYAAERKSLNTKALEQFVVSAPKVKLPDRGAIIFPHTRLVGSGQFTAAAARAVIESGCETIVALGVLHGIPRDRSDWYSIHPSDALTQNEFSLDNFEVLLNVAAKLSGRPMPKFIPKFPFGTGVKPKDLTGFADLISLVEQGVALVATADMVHHGADYGTPERSRLAIQSDKATEYANISISSQLRALEVRDYSSFLEHCESAHSDFRDVGPVLAELLPRPAQSSIADMALINYADVLKAEEPTWVAAALITIGTS